MELFRIEIEAKKGEWLNRMFPHGATKEHPRNTKKVKLDNAELKKMPVTFDEIREILKKLRCQMSNLNSGKLRGPESITRKMPTTPNESSNARLKPFGQ